MLQFLHWQIRTPSNLTRFVLLALLSVSLMLLDARGHHLQKIRAGLTVLFVPIQIVAAIPVRVGGSVIDFIRGGESRRKEAARMRSEQQILLARLQKYEAIEAENAHLRQLLGTTAPAADRAAVAAPRAIASCPDPHY